MSKEQKQLTWLTIAMIAFNMVWGLGNVVNNFESQGLTVVVSWVLILAIYFIPYALIVGQLGSTFKESGGGVSDWVEQTSSKRIAYYAAWTYWVVHIPYLAQKPQRILIALGWALQGNGDVLKSMSMPMIVALSLVILGLFLWLSTKGLSALKIIGGLSGTAMFFMSILFVLLAIGAPFIKQDLQVATSGMEQITTYLPKFDLHYFTTISLLVFAVGGAEKISPYVNQTRNPAREFPKGMIAMAIMVGMSAILGSFAMGMLFDAHNMPTDLMRNGAYVAFERLGDYYGVGKLLMIIYALTEMVGQIAAMAFSIDAPLLILLNNADAAFIPSWLRKRSPKGTLVNGYLLTGALVAILIMLPLMGISEIDGLVKWMTKLNSVVMPMRYMWVFFAYMLLNRQWKKFQGAEYRFIKNPTLGFWVGAWCFLFTAFACVLGMIPSTDRAADPAAWDFQLWANLLTPLLLVALGLILPYFARREQERSSIK